MQTIRKIIREVINEDIKTAEIYYHGRAQTRPYSGDYLFLTDDFGYASGFSDGKAIYAYKLKIPKSEIFSIKNLKHFELLNRNVDPGVIHSIKISSPEEIDWSAFGNIGNDDYELPEDLLASLGFKGAFLTERKGIESIYLFDQGDAELVEKIDITTPDQIKRIGDWYKEYEKTHHEADYLLEVKLKEKKLKSILKSNEAFQILDNSKEASGTDWQMGGCWILADALSAYYGLPLYVVYSKDLNQVEHFMVKIKDMYLDSDGIQSGSQMRGKISADFPHHGILEILPYDKTMNTSDIVRDPEISNQLIQLFQSNK